MTAQNSPTRIFLINVGANKKQESRARSPLFLDRKEGRDFCYVPFYSLEPTEATREYPEECLEFLNPRYRADISGRAHDDPDWPNLTYGDCCKLGRGAALKSANVNDIFLFWGRLSHNSGRGWKGFTGRKGWYLFGCLRIQEKLFASKIDALAAPDRKRALQNIHFRNEKELPQDDYVFVGNPSYSALFPRAINLGVEDKNGLLYRAFTAADGSKLSRNGKPEWSSSLRTCRIVIDLGNKAHEKRAKILQTSVAEDTHFDLFKDIKGW